MRNTHFSIVVVCCMLATSCSNPVETTLKGETYEKNFSFSFKSEVIPFSTKSTAGIPFFNIPDPTTKTDEVVDPPTPPNPTPSTLAAPTVIQKYLYSEDKLVSNGVIKKKENSFPDFTERFTKGVYKYLFIAHSEEEITIDNNNLTFSEVPDVFIGTENFEIPTTNAKSTPTSLERCIARIEVASDTPTPSEVKSISIQTTNFLNTLNIKTNCGVKPNEYIAEKTYVFNKEEETTKNPIPTDQLFTTGFNTFMLSSEDQSSQKLSLMITITYNDDKTITHTISDIDPVTDKIIQYTGNIFSQSGSFSFDVKSDWSGGIEQRPI
ncbi:MAG: hypothetical protein ACRDCN_04570 [Tannerellaceae bacterium]